MQEYQKSSSDESTSEPLSTLPAPLQSLAARAPRLARWIQFAWRLGERWGVDRCGLVAAAMAFFGLLSLFPLMLAAVTILGKVLAGEPRLLQKFLVFVQEFFPGATGAVLQQRVTGEVQTVASGGAAISVFSLLSLLWSGRAFFDTLAGVLNSIWPNAQPRSWLQHQIALWSTFIGVGVLWVLSTLATVAQSLVRGLSEYLPDLFINSQPLFWWIVSLLVSWALTILMFWMMYRFLPNAQPGGRGRVALISAVVAATLWEIAKRAFTLYLPDATRYGAVYGGVASVVLLLMWLYFSSTIILLGAEIAAAWCEVEAVARGEEKPTLDRIDDAAESLGDIDAQDETTQAFSETKTRPHE